MVIIYLLLLFVVNTNCAIEGDSCFKKDIPGVCANIRVCPDAQQDVANKKHPVICDFTQEDPIVCCISSETISTTTESATTVNCILPPYPEHGTYVSNIPDGKPGEEYNSLHINVTCQEGYTIDGLDGSFFCRKGLGWWPGQIPKCKQEYPDTPSKGLSSDQIPSFVQPSCDISETKSSDVSGSICKGQLLFEDSFKESIDKKRIWSPEIKFPAEPDFPFNVYLNEESLQVKGGILNIKPITLESKYGENFVRKSLDLADRCTALGGTTDCSRVATGPQILPPIITSKITTRNKFAFKYGRVEISAKMPQGDWLIPEIQLEPRSNAYGISNYASGLLRVATVKGNVEYGKKLYAGPIMADQEPYRSAHLKEKVGRDLWNIDFHNYTLEWRPDGISLYVDGENYGNISPGEGFYQSAVENQGKTASSWLRGTVMAPFDEMFYISLGLSVGGVNEFPDTSDKPWKNRSIKAILNFWNARDQWYSTWHDDTSALQVDYVRIYAL